MSNHLNNFSIIPSIQYGFTPPCSTSTDLLKATTDFTEAMDRGNLTLLIELDYSKAFYKTHDDLLLAKLNYYGCSEVVICWFKNFLKGRQQLIKIRHLSSGLLDTRQGVPQGSVLAPTLLSIFIADLNNNFIHTG